MDQDLPDTGRYKPSINIERAPRLGVPFLYILTAYVFCATAGIMLWVYAPWVSRGAYGYPPVIMTVHFFTLGFLSMTAMGILSQWVPVVFNVRAFGNRRGWAHFFPYLLGALALFWSVGHGAWPVVAASGTLLALAIVWWSVDVITQLTRSTAGKDAVYWGIVGAVVGFNAVWMLGLFMALSFLGWWPEYRALEVHIATALAGWMGFLVLTVQLKLNPMFSMSRAEGIRPSIPLGLTGLGVALAWASLFLGDWWLRLAAVLWTTAALVSIGQGLRTVTTGKAKAFDRVFVGVAAAWALLLLAAVLAIWLRPVAVVVAFWGFLTLIFSYQARILPFIVAVAVAKRLPGPVYKAFFMAQAMHPKNQPVIVGILGVVGAALFVAGRWTMQTGLVRASALVALLLVLSELVGIALAMSKGRAKAPVRP